MAGVDVAGCIAAVVSAFHGGADLAQALREKNDRKKKKKEKDIEQAHEEKMLHKSLVDGARQVQLACVDRRQRFGRPFDTGDATATSELKDVMINLQTEIIGVLQFARTVENSPLDCAPLYEAAITNKTAAIRAMDELCQRIVMGMPSQRQLQDERPTSPVYARNGSLGAHYRMPSDTSVKYRMSPSSYMSSSGVNRPDLQRISSPKASAYTRGSVRAKGRDSMPIHEFYEEDEAHELEQTSSLHDSAIGSDAILRHRPSASVTSTVLSDDTVGSTGSAESGAKRDELRIVQSRNQRASVDSDDSTAIDQSDTCTPAQWPTQALEQLDSDSDDYEHRANSAPEVVTKEFESLMLSPNSQKKALSPQFPSNIHPALRGVRPDSSYDILAPEPDRLWSPLNRPAKHNNYHNFCKGAWNSRHSLQEGLAIALIPNHKNVTVAHWQCKHCAFRSRGMTNSKILPDQIYFSNAGIRYRWLFLAKSHVPAKTSHVKPELYPYGCIFCAAQGRMTQVYEGLDKMMEHIVNKHRTDMLTPEVLLKTKCVVGGAPDRSGDWDVNIPVTTRRVVTKDVKDFVVSAVTGIL